MTSLPTGIVAGNSGHISHHNTVHALLNPVDAPFEVAPVLVESFYADRPAAGQAGRLFGAVDTGAFEFDDGATWRGLVALVFVDDLTERDALSPSVDTVVIIRDINRMHRWDGTRWVASDEVHGINALDYGYQGIGAAHDDRASVVAAGQASSASGDGNHVVLIPYTPGGYCHFSSSITVPEMGGNGFVVRGLGGPGYPSGFSQFRQWPAVPIKCDSGACFVSTGRNGVIAFEYLDAYQGRLFEGIPDVSDGLTAQVRFWRCAGTAPTDGSTENAPVVIDRGFWYDIDECALNGAHATTVTTSSTTLSTSPFTVNVSDASDFPDNGYDYAVIGADTGGATRVFSYTGKTATSLTGCTTPDTGTFLSGTAVSYRGPAVIIKGGADGVNISYLLRLRNSIISGTGVHYHMDPQSGPVVTKILLEYVQNQNCYLGHFNFFNDTGATTYVHNVQLHNVTEEDPVAGASVLNSAIFLDGDDDTVLYKSEVAYCDHSLSGGNRALYARAANCSVALEVRGAATNTLPFAGDTSTSITGSSLNGDRTYSGTIAAHTSTRSDGASWYRKRSSSAAEVSWQFSAGSPEGSVTAEVGSICSDVTNGKLYVKATGTGNTGWVVAGTQT